MNPHIDPDDFAMTIGPIERLLEKLYDDARSAEISREDAVDQTRIEITKIMLRLL